MNSARIAALLKEHGWVLNLFFIALGGYFVAGAANSVVARSIRVVPTADSIKASSGPSRKPASQSRAAFASMVDRNLFGAQKEIIASEMPLEVEEDASSVSGRDYNYDDLKKCTIPGTVRATLVAEAAPEWSMAVIYLNSDREASVFSINEGHNEIAPDAVLVDVLSREVVVRRRDHFELCPCEGEGGAPTTPTRTPALKTSSATSSGGGEGVTKVSATEYRIDGGYIDDTLANLNKVATQARIVPSFKNGKANGFKLFSIKPGSIYSKIGMQNGDVIQKVNGYEINSPDKALELYQKLKDARGVTLELMRRGQTQSIQYNIDR